MRLLFHFANLKAEPTGALSEAVKKLESSAAAGRVCFEFAGEVARRAAVAVGAESSSHSRLVRAL